MSADRTPLLCLTQGGVHICEASQAPELAKKMLGGTLVTKQTGAKVCGAPCPLAPSAVVAHAPPPSRRQPVPIRGGRQAACCSA